MAGEHVVPQRAYHYQITPLEVIKKRKNLGLSEVLAACLRLSLRCSVESSSE